jgi:ribonuclease ZC3H12
VKGKSLSLPLEGCIEKQSGGLLRKAPLSRTKSSVVTSSEETGGLSGSNSYQENLHKKLQRQLSLAPGCDPRLYQGRRHTGVSRHVSCEPLSHQHSSVTRIASAPAPSSLHCLPHHSLSSASDPSLWPHPPTPSATEEARCRLHYHLASIFPEDQVRAAMHLYPTETNPKKICALILALSSKP